MDSGRGRRRPVWKNLIPAGLNRDPPLATTRWSPDPTRMPAPQAHRRCCFLSVRRRPRELGASQTVVAIHLGDQEVSDSWATVRVGRRGGHCIDAVRANDKSHGDQLRRATET